MQTCSKSQLIIFHQSIHYIFWPKKLKLSFHSTDPLILFSSGNIKISWRNTFDGYINWLAVSKTKKDMNIVEIWKCMHRNLFSIKKTDKKILSYAWGYYIFFLKTLICLGFLETRQDLQTEIDNPTVDCRSLYDYYIKNLKYWRWL